MAKRILIGTVLGIAVLGAAGLLLGDTGSDANEEASAVYVVAIGVATVAAIAWLGATAFRARRRREGRRPVRNDATRG